MFTGDYIYQYIDWWHSPIGSEDFDHLGLLKSKLLNIGVTIGLNDYWNVTISQLLGERCMEWEVEDESVHHRTECSSTNFINSNGGHFGDTRFNFKYLLSNQGKGPGERIFLGAGFVIPSNNILTESPFLQNNSGGYDEHRHFALSDGTCKIFSEIQYFKKRMQFPVFWGTTFTYEHPLETSKYGFLPSKAYNLSIMAISGPIDIKTNFLKISSIGLSLSVIHTTEAEWNNIAAPNSRSTAYIPGLSVLFMSKIGTFGINIQKPHMDNLATNDGGVEQDAELWQFSISYRKVLDKVIDKLYW